jgi:DNA mismatch repair protein MutL
MPLIQIMPDQLASQVAAGEVVERPASVVKELVENALDAQAHEISVEIERGGVALIRVTDDGKGMDREDALLCLERHATSKLRFSSDLGSILTLGFRGEALPSIASVSRFRLLTRDRQSVAASEILMEGGVMREVRDGGCAPGTCMEVRQLFYNMPARRKFLKTPVTESAHVEHEIRLHAMAYHGVRFRYVRDGAEVFDLPAVQRRADRLRHMLGTETAGDLIEIPEFRGRGFVLSGFLLSASHARKGRKHQCLFLNGRPIEDPAVSRGISEGFKGGLTDGQNPAAWLWMEMDPSLVDVNVHPAKREVRFQNALDLREGCAHAVSQALQAWHDARSLPVRLAEAKSFAPALPKDEAEAVPAAVTARAWLPLTKQASLAFTAVPEMKKVEVEAAQAGAAVPVRERFRFLEILHGRFVMLESADGLVLFDPRAGRERIVYEELRGTLEMESQALLVPLLVNVEPREHELAMRHAAVLHGVGWDIGDFGSGTIQIRAVPAFLEIADPLAFFREMLDDLLAGGAAVAHQPREKLARIIARRAGLLQVAEARSCMELLERLFACDLPYCAADGRPTLTEFSMRELERRFGK